MVQQYDSSQWKEGVTSKLFLYFTLNQILTFVFRRIYICISSLGIESKKKDIALTQRSFIHMKISCHDNHIGYIASVQILQILHALVKTEMITE